jgi:hypothetical protein
MAHVLAQPQVLPLRLRVHQQVDLSVQLLLLPSVEPAVLRRDLLSQIFQHVKLTRQQCRVRESFPQHADLAKVIVDQYAFDARSSRIVTLELLQRR